MDSVQLCQGPSDAGRIGSIPSKKNRKYSGKTRRLCATADDGDCFFHAAFGTRVEDDGPYRDEHAEFRRTNWSTFLKYHSFERLTGALQEHLKKCFMAHERCRNKCIKTAQDYRDYANAISGSNYCVLTEEIPVLATLENTRIILFTNDCDEPEVFEPDSELLRNYPFRRASEVREVVICLFGKHFLRVESTEASSLKRFAKLGSAGIKGSLYQIKLLTMVFLNAMRKVNNWRLSTEDKEAAQFDDLVFQYLPSASTVLLQAKHKEDEKKKVTLKDLMSVNKKNLEFSIPKYFFSYQELKGKFKVQYVVICTNLKLDGKTKGILKEESVDPGNVLHIEGAENICYGFSGCSFPELKENIKMYYAKNVKGKKAIISDEDINNYLKHLKFFCLDDKTVDRGIYQTISYVKFSENLKSEMIQHDIRKYIMEWFQEKKGRYLTEVDAKALLCDNRSYSYCEGLKLYNISFKNNNLPLILQTQQEKEESGKKSRKQNYSDAPVKDPKRISHIIPDKEYILNVVKIYQALPTHHKDKTLFVNPDETVEVQKEIIDAFEVQHYTILVMVCPVTIEKTIAEEMCARLMQILNTYKYKHVILIAEERNNLAIQLKQANIDYYEVLTANITFGDLEETTCEGFKQRKCIHFQGSTMSLKELFTPPTDDDLNQTVTSEMLITLAQGGRIEVGLGLSHPDNYYIHRSFNQKGKNISEGDLWRSTEEKVILVSDSAGMGKSCVLTSLAVSIKKDNPYLWVVRIDLRNYTNIMRTALDEGRKSVSITELLNSQETSKLKSEFGKKLFTTPRRIVLMLDGVDEVSPAYTELVINLIRDSLAQVNLAKIFVTTRPHMSKDLEEIVKLQSFTLEPFSKLNQVEFLIKYWTETLNLQDDVRKSKCNIYAEALIDNISKWIKEQHRNNFAEIPLQTRMLAEIFQEKNEICDEEHDWEGCKEFLSSNNDEPKLPTKIEITQLYEMFMNKKRNIYITINNPSGNLAADEALKLQFEECQKYHRALALKEIFKSDNELQRFTCYTSVEGLISSSFANNILFRVGIVQRQGEDIEFLHRTFAEYFVTDCLLIELEQKSVNEAFQEFFMKSILVDEKFYVVRAFLESRLPNGLHLIENNVGSYFRRNRISVELLSRYFKVYVEEGCAGLFKCLIESIAIEQRTILSETVNNLYEMYKVIHSAIRYGHLNIIKLLLELNETFNEGRAAHELFLQCAVMGAVKLNSETLKFLLVQVDKRGENIFGRTCLHDAAFMGLFETVQFLVERWKMDINTKSAISGWTALHEAVLMGRLEIVTFLVEVARADINIEDSTGETVFHMAARRGELEIIKCLVENAGVDVNVKTNVSKALYLAAFNGELEIVKYLVEEAGADINVKSGDGTTALHWAAANGKLEILKYLVEEAGADINVKSGDGTTALHLIAANDRLEIFKYLVEEAGADINFKSNNGSTALHSVASYNKLEIIKYLVEEARVDVNVKTNYGRTALHWAASNGKLEIVKYLVEEAGADVNVKDDEGSTAFDIANKLSRRQIINFLSNLHRSK